jgi:hypothetical protein
LREMGEDESYVSKINSKKFFKKDKKEIKL